MRCSPWCSSFSPLYVHRTIDGMLPTPMACQLRPLPVRRHVKLSKHWSTRFEHQLGRQVLERSNTALLCAYQFHYKEDGVLTLDHRPWGESETALYAQPRPQTLRLTRTTP